MQYITTHDAVQSKNSDGFKRKNVHKKKDDSMKLNDEWSTSIAAKILF